MTKLDNCNFDNGKYLESIISTYRSLDGVIHDEIRKGTSEDVIKVLDRQIDTVFSCIAEFQPNTEKERELLLRFSMDMIEERLESSHLAASCLNIIRRNIDSSN